MKKLMDLNQFLINSTEPNPKKVSLIVKYIFANEGCSIEQIATGTNLEQDIISRYK